MRSACRILLEIPQGRTFSEPLRWAQKRLAYRQIQAVAAAAPCVLTTTLPHGVPEGWPITVSGAKGMTEINSVQLDGEEPRIYEATVIDATNIEINDVDASAFRAYTGGGVLRYNVPMDLSAFTNAEMQVRPRVDSSEILLGFSTTDGSIVFDNTAKTITLSKSAVLTAALTWLTGVWDMEAFSSGGIVTPVAYGDIAVIREVTR